MTEDTLLGGYMKLTQEAVKAGYSLADVNLALDLIKAKLQLEILEPVQEKKKVAKKK